MINAYLFTHDPIWLIGLAIATLAGCVLAVWLEKRES
jgi:hypothetical protein